MDKEPRAQGSSQVLSSTWLCSAGMNPPVSILPACLPAEELRP